MKLRKLSAKDKRLFNSFLRQKRHELSAYAFENIYIWRGLFEIFWAEVKGNLCLFFKNKSGCFLYLPPLGGKLSADIISEVFTFMESENSLGPASRIENVEEKDTDFYEDIGYECVHKSYDYVYEREKLALLKGDKFKKKRSALNYFVKHYHFQYLPFSLKFKGDCLRLYDSWMSERKIRNSDPVYVQMLEDSRSAFHELLNSYRKSDCTGRLIVIRDEVRAFTFGFELNRDMFCILYEIADLSIKGISQFIFREFCSELKHKFINACDDSTLESLKRVKASYRPMKLIPSYIVRKRGL